MKRDTRCILVDTREKQPWKFAAQKAVALKHGDYSILGGKGKIVIERKALADLFVTLSPGRWVKFEAKMRRAIDQLDYVFLFIEASIAEVYFGTRYSKLPAKYFIGKLIELMEMGIQVIFTGNSKKGPQLAETILRTLG